MVEEMDYKALGKDLIQLLDNAHNPSVAKIRGEFFKAEYKFFRENILEERVLVLGSGLGHDAFELCNHYDRKVVGLEIIKELLEEADRRKHIIYNANVYFYEQDFLNIGKKIDFFRSDVSVLNMGTFGNFENKQDVLESIIRFAPITHLDFYLPGKENNILRKKMYEEESYTEVKIKGNTIYTDSGLSSEAISKEYFLELFNEVAKKNPERNLKLKFTDFYKFATMATITSK
jgi:SAM-dependent methyltransferase